MKNCKDIENILPLYADGLLSAAEKRAVEEHLAQCVD
jgi:anti-sigma factor RsiW